MTRPRLAAILSAIVASTVAFFVTHRWSLAGTLTGAAVVPVVYSLVSHWSNEGLERLVRWTRERAGEWRRRPKHPGEDSRLGRRSAVAPADPAPADALAADPAPATARQPEAQAAGQSSPTPTVYATRGWVRRRSSSLQWWLTAAVLLAFGFSLYSFATAGSTRQVVVEKQVIEKRVLVPGADSAPDTGAESATTTTTTLTSSGDSTTTGDSAATTSTQPAGDSNPPPETAPSTSAAPSP